MSITLYYAPRSSATRVHWALEELQIPYAKVKVDLDAGDQRKPEFLRLNPNGKVPCLVDESTPLFESFAILIHLGQKYGVSRGLWPNVTSALQGQALSWTVWSAVSLSAAAYKLALGLSPRPAEERNEGRIEKDRAALVKLLDVLEQRLGDAPHILGPSFTLVDLAVGASLTFLMRTGFDLSAHPRTKAWFTQVLSRPAYATVTRD